jgi:hypothetical protein
MTGIRHEVTAADLRALATTDRRSLLRDADTLIDCDEGIIRVPFRVVEETLAGRGRLTLCRLLYAREWFIDDGVLIGKTPRTTDGSSLDERLAVIADGLNAPVSQENHGPDGFTEPDSSAEVREGDPRPRRPPTPPADPFRP